MADVLLPKKTRKSRIRELEAQLAEARECNEVEQYARLMKRIEQLEAEIQVRDNSSNEVLRILREATGRCDFHSEMEAAEHAAQMLAEARLEEFRKEFMCQQGCYMWHDIDGESCWLVWPHGRSGEGQIESQPNRYATHNASIDAAMKETPK